MTERWVAVLCVGLFAMTVLIPGLVRAPTTDHVPFTSVDIAGDEQDSTTKDHRVAASWRQNVTLLSAKYFNGSPNYTTDMGWPVDYVVLSADGAYLAVVGNDRPLNSTSQGHLRLYGPIANPVGPWPLLYTITLNHSAWSDGSRPVDLARDGSYVAVGTEVVNYGASSSPGYVYLYQTPASPGTPTSWSYNWADWIQAVRFSGRGTEIIVGGFFTHAWKRFHIPAGGGLTLDCTYAGGDVYYSVSPSSNAGTVAAGQGSSNDVGAYTSSSTTCGQSWSTTKNGQFRRLSMADDASYFIAAHFYDSGSQDSSFYLFHPGSSTADWTYTPATQPTGGAPTYVDSAVKSGGKMCIGNFDTHVYRWEHEVDTNHHKGCKGTSGTGGASPEFDYTAGARVNDVAMTYTASNSLITYYVAGDNDGTLYLFHNTGANTDWTWAD